MNSELGDLAAPSLDEKRKEIERRKWEHIRVCVDKDVEMKKTNGFEEFELVPKAVTEISLEEIDTSAVFLGHHLKVPLLISAMTGGFEGAKKINSDLSQVCEKFGLAMGVGSQRAAIEDASLSYTYDIRDVAPNIFLIGNIGITQLIQGWGIDEAREAIEMIKANALAVHVNALQEIFQPEGDVNFRGGLTALKELCESVNFPIIVKEVGSGISYESAQAFAEAGVSAIDVGGAGGTSWARVEYFRHAGDSSDSFLDLLFDWGIPTAYSLLEVRKGTNLPLIGSGGIRNGIEIAKALILGSSITGIALPILRVLQLEGINGVERLIEEYISQLREVMFLVGSKNLEILRNSRNQLVPQKNARNWIEARELRPLGDSN
ncbi:MAG: type 2 isopentenyl-diphosphate Delta-isomerase [Promethearchaeota archaeon]